MNNLRDIRETSVPLWVVTPSIFSFAFYFFPFILAGNESKPEYNSDLELVVVPGISLFRFADRAHSLG